MNEDAQTKPTPKWYPCVVLEIPNALALFRMLEYWMEDRRFEDPRVAVETFKQAAAAMDSMDQQLCYIRQHTDGPDDYGDAAAILDAVPVPISSRPRPDPQKLISALAQFEAAIAQ